MRRLGLYNAHIPSLAYFVPLIIGHETFLLQHDHRSPWNVKDQVWGVYLFVSVIFSPLKQLLSDSAVLLSFDTVCRQSQRDSAEQSHRNITVSRLETKVNPEGRFSTFGSSRV